MGRRSPRGTSSHGCLTAGGIQPACLVQVLLRLRPAQCNAGAEALSMEVLRGGDAVPIL